MRTAGLALLLALPAFPQVLTPFVVPLRADSGPRPNAGAAPRIVWEHLVEVPGAAWLRVRFAAAVLPGSSRLELHAFRDGARQVFTATTLRDWFPWSGYFNGGAVLVRLVAAPGTAGARVALAGAEVGFAPAGPDSICGPKDDRVLARDRRVARLMPGGCTAWIGTSRGLIFTAGHCARWAQLVEFNVPLSNKNGSLNHPPPQDQFPLVRNLGGISNPNACDWAVYLPGKNTLNQTPLQRQGAYFKLATLIPPVLSTLRITGYGVAQGTWNQALKTVTGPLAGTGSGRCGPYLVAYRVDSMNGDSGAPVIDEATGRVVAVHSGGGCTLTGGSNKGSAVTNADLQRLVTAPIPPLPGPLAPEDLVLSHQGFFDVPRVARVDRSLRAFGFLASFPGPLGGVIMAPDNVHLLVLQDRPDALLLVSPWGTTATLAALGTGGRPTALALDQDGTVLVAATDNVLRRVTPAGTVTTVLALPASIFDRTNALARDEETGHFLVGVWRQGRLYEVDAAAGRVLRTVAQGLGAVYGVDVDPATGSYVVVTYSTPEVRVLARDGKVVRSWSFPYLQSLRVDPRTGIFHCAGFGHVVDFAPDGTKVDHFGPYVTMSFAGIEVYASRRVTGLGNARPGSFYPVSLHFPGWAGASYRVALAFARRPGIPLGRWTLHLRPDALFRASLGGAFLVRGVGTLDAFGRAAVGVRIPPGVPKGLTFFVSAVALRGGAMETANTIGVTVR